MEMLINNLLLSLLLSQNHLPLHVFLINRRVNNPMYIDRVLTN